MKMFKKFLALVTVAFWATTAFANAGEERILERSASSDKSWQEYLGELAKQAPLQVGGEPVMGYDPVTGLVSTAAIMQRVCYNQAPVWKQACADPGERFTAFATRNGWTKVTIAQADLRDQARKGIYFPFAGTPVAQEQATATPAPVATATKAEATPPVSTAAATPPTTSGVTAEEVAQVAKAAAATQLQGFDKALQALNGQVEAKDGVLRDLRKQIAGAPSAAKVAQLEKKLQATVAARESDAAARQELVEQLAATKAAMDTEVSKLPEVAATAAAATVKPFVAKISGDVSVFKADVNGRVSAVEDSWFIKYQLYIASIGGGILVFLAFLGVINWRRTTKVRVEAVQAAEDKIKEEVEPVMVAVSDLTDRMSSVEATSGRFDFSFSDDLVMGDVRAVAVGGEVAFTFKVDGDPVEHAVVITRESEDYVRVNGIVGQSQRVKIDGLVARIKRAYVKRHLVTQQPAATASANAAILTQVA